MKYILSAIFLFLHLNVISQNKSLINPQNKEVIVFGEIGEKSGVDSIELNTILVQKGISIKVKPDYQISLKLIGFTVFALRNNEILFNNRFYNQFFDTDIYQLLKSLKAGDVIIFYNMKVEDKSNNLYYVAPIELHIK